VKVKLVSWLAGYLVIGSVISLSAIGSAIDRSGIGRSASDRSAIAAGTDVSGVVRDARGRPIFQARVSLMRVDDAPPEKPGGKPTKTLVELDTMRTSRTGAFRFAAVSNGHYQLLTASGNNWLIAEGLVLDGKPRPPIVLTLDGKTRVISLKAEGKMQKAEVR
jgi:hypothetical protein